MLKSAFSVFIISCTYLSGTVYAADLTTSKAAPVWSQYSGKTGFQDTTWIFRAGITGMQTDISSRFAIERLPVTDKFDVSNSFAPFANFSYLITPNIGVELGATLLPHKLKTEGLLNDLTGNKNKKLQLPVFTAMAQYHFHLTSTIKPYIGAGVNYSYARDIGGGRQLKNVGLNDHWGWALQAGVDIALTESWGINLDIKKLQLATDVHAPLRRNRGGILTGRVDNKPLLISAGITYRF